MNAIILAAGKGTRLQPLTNHTPKSLLEIQGKPVLAHTIENLPDEVTSVIIVVRHLGYLIKEYFGTKWGGKKITYVNAMTLRGTADMIRQVKRFVKGKTLVLHGDDLYKKSDLVRLIAEVQENEWGILAKEWDDVKQFGVLALSKDGKLLEIIEKPENPPSHLVNTGAYILDERIFAYRPAKLASGEYGLPQTMTQAKNEVPTRVVLASFWQPVNTMSDYKEAQNAPM